MKRGDSLGFNSEEQRTKTNVILRARDTWETVNQMRRRTVSPPDERLPSPPVSPCVSQCVCVCDVYDSTSVPARGCCSETLTRVFFMVVCFVNPTGRLLSPPFLSSLLLCSPLLCSALPSSLSSPGGDGCVLHSDDRITERLEFSQGHGWPSVAGKDSSQRWIQTGETRQRLLRGWGGA